GLEPVERERAPQRHHDAEYDFLATRVIDSTASAKSFEHTEIVNENRNDAGDGTETDRNDEHQCAPQRRSASWGRGESVRRFTKASAASSTPRRPRRSSLSSQRLSRSTCSALASGSISSSDAKRCR